MTELVEDLLDVSRVTRGLVELHLELLDLREIVSHAVEQATPLIEARHHTLVLDLPDAPLLVRGDRLRLIQVMSNLLNNAAKYTAQEGRIAVVLEFTQNEIEISVADNGIGIDAAALPRMFELFTQAERTSDRAQGGLGLGLPLVKHIINLHAGEVAAHSEGRGSGSTFVIRLPRLGDSADGTTLPSGKCDAAPLQPMNVMVVDDNLDAARSLGALLEARGHRVRLASDGNTALQLAFAEPAQVFILDIGLPGMDGLEIARRLRAHPGTKASTLLAHTGYGQAHDRILSKSAGFDAHFVKPTPVAQIEAAFYTKPDLP